MDPAYIKPFIASIHNVFSTMLQLPVSVNEPTLKADSGTSCDVSGIIGMSGDMLGSVVLSFPRETAERVVALFSGQKLDPASPDFADAVGELVNMVSGGAKAMFKDRRVSISCPSVVVGAGHHVARQTDAPTVCIPCTTDCGDFVIELTIQDKRPATQTGTAASIGAGKHS